MFQLSAFQRNAFQIGSTSPHGWDDGAYHIAQTIVREFDKPKTVENVFIDEPINDIEPEVIAKTYDKEHNERIILENRRMADTLLLLEYNITCKLERHRLMNDYAMVLLLLDD